MITFHNINAEDCTIVEHDLKAGYIRIKHPDFPRPRYFSKSKKGNWYWMKYVDGGEAYKDKEIWIIKGDIVKIVEETTET